MLPAGPPPVLPGAYGSPYGQGRSGFGPPPGPRPPGHKNNNGLIAGVIAAVIIVGGVGTTVALASNADQPKLTAGSSSLPSGATGLPSGATGLPSGATGVPGGGEGMPGGGSAPADVTDGPVSGGGTDEFSADSATSDYFDALEANDYTSSMALFCDPSTFPLTPTDVSNVEVAYPNGSALSSGSATASSTGSVTLVDGTAYTLTLYLDEQSDQTWCIDHQVSVPQ